MRGKRRKGMPRAMRMEAMAKDPALRKATSLKNPKKPRMPKIELKRGSRKKKAL